MQKSKQRNPTASNLSYACSLHLIGSQFIPNFIKPQIRHN